MSLLLYCTFLLTLGQCVLGQQPHDLCYEDFRYAPDHIYPNDWHVIVDSYDYQDLFEDSISVWELRDVDGDGRGWSDTFGGTCQKEIGVGSCTSGTSNPDNWFFTSFNSYDNAIEVIIDVTFRWTQCSPGSCANVAVYRYDTDGPVSESQQRDPNNYTPVTGNVMTSRLQQNQPTNVDTNVVLRFTRPSSFNGLYLGFRDTGACKGQIKRFQVYYRIAPEVRDGFLFCPEVPLVRGSSSSSTCRCAENSNTTGSLERVCSDSTDCSELPVCQCIPGYMFSDSTSVPRCQACQTETFKAVLSNETVCQPCPTNSEARNSASAVCMCVPPNIRNPDRPGDNCTQPPSPPRLSPRQPSVDGTFVTVCWVSARDNGGLSDLHYNIYVNRLRNKDESYTRVNDEGIFDNGSGDQDNSVGNLCYEVSGLDAKASYSILITSANGATGDPLELQQDLDLVDGQYLAFFVTTGEGGLRKSGAIAVTFFVTAIIFTIGVAVTTALLMWIFCVKGGKAKATYTENGHSETKHGYSNKSSDASTPPKKRPPAPPRTKI